MTRRRSMLALLIAASALAGCGTDDGGPSAEAGPASEEIVLDERIAERARRAAGEPVAEPAGEMPPASPASPAGSSSERVPRRILRENAKLRRDLEDLKALEAANRRVERALAASGRYTGPLRIGPGGLAWPVNGPNVSPFGQRWGRLHAGIDIAVPAGTPIRTAADGQVILSGPTGGYGNYVCVAHGPRLATCYAHLSQILVERGTVLSQGQVLGLVGCTGHCFGDHLHFETRVDGSPVDPEGYL